MSSVGLLGGTFNPIHNGHVAIARQAREVLALDRVVLIPTGDPPHKPHENLAAAKDRFEMVRLAIASDPSLSISDVEVRRSGKSYTIDTIRLLQQEYGPEARLFFLIGLDAFLEFPTWRDPATLLTLCSFVVLSRPGLSFQALSEIAVHSTHSASIPRGVGCRTERTSGRPCRRPIADLPALAAEQRVGIGHSRKNCTGSSHGKSVAACGGILYTSTSYLLRGRRSHEHQRPRPLPLRRPCSTRRPRMSSSSTLRS